MGSFVRYSKELFAKNFRGADIEKGHLLHVAGGEHTGIIVNKLIDEKPSGFNNEELTSVNMSEVSFGCSDVTVNFLSNAYSVNFSVAVFEVNYP